MPEVDVLKEILAWSENRPDWQRDALRRLLVNGELVEADIEELSQLCKKAHGLSEVDDAVLLAEEHMPEGGEDNGQVFLESIYHHKGVNALAEKQTLNFGNNLTVVYGDNASGKSGYTRILKEACQARGAEEILGNVLSGVMPEKPTVAIRYRIGDGGDSQEWTGHIDDDSISRVSVFDTHAAAVYLNEKTDVAFRPFGLDLFDKLVKACQAVRQIMEREERTQKYSLIKNLEFPEGTETAKLVNSITSLTQPKKIIEKATLTEGDEKNLALLEKRLLDLQSKDPAKLIKELKLSEKRFRTLSDHLKNVDRALSDERVESVFALQKETTDKSKVASELQEKTFPEGLLEGTGGDKWRDLWEVAREFSVEVAYQGRGFPVTEDEVRCLLCQQDIKGEAAEKLKQFEAFIQSAAEREFQKTRVIYRKSYKGFDELQVVTQLTEEAVNEILIDNEIFANDVENSLIQAEVRRKAVVQSLGEKQGFPNELATYPQVRDKIATLIEQLVKRGEELTKSATPEIVKQVRLEMVELQARQKLGKHLKTIILEIERKKKIAAYSLCIKDTNTKGITTKSGALTKEVVTKQLQKSFSEELEKLRFRHVEVELQEAGGKDGVFYHKVVLKRAPGINVPKVVSEGEARCLSIAAFFAELSTADEESTILFDDPVSSLDYKWRGHVAARLVKEAKHRQVIVFTHDIVFLLALRQLAEKDGVANLDQHIRQLRHIGAGVCKEELPWVAMAVKKRIGFMKNEWQGAKKLYRDGYQDAYEKDAGQIYGFLREAWERALEEVLLGGVVERYRKNVQTLNIAMIADITIEDCAELDQGMTKCSEWLTGHDQAPAAKDDMPDPDELEGDILLLEGWVKRIRKRRGG